MTTKREKLQEALDAAIARSNAARTALKAAQRELQAAQNAEVAADGALLRYDLEQELAAEKA